MLCVRHQYINLCAILRIIKSLDIFPLINSLALIRRASIPWIRGPRSLLELEPNTLTSPANCVALSLENCSFALRCILSGISVRESGASEVC